MAENDEIFSLSWTKFMKNNVNNDCFNSKSTIYWNSIEIEITIHCFWGNGPGGLRTHYTFNVDGVLYNYNLIQSYMVGTNGNKPKIYYKDQELRINAGPTSIEIIVQPKSN